MGQLLFKIISSPKVVGKVAPPSLLSNIGTAIVNAVLK